MKAETTYSEAPSISVHVRCHRGHSFDIIVGDAPTVWIGVKRTAQEPSIGVSNIGLFDGALIADSIARVKRNTHMRGRVIDEKEDVQATLGHVNDSIGLRIVDGSTTSAADTDFA